MAHATRSLELIQGLVSSITKTQDVSKTQSNRVAKSLREHNFARTNQFAVKAKLDGLIEKFSVLDRDDLAEALELRLNDLKTDDKFLPDKLALLLELSDLPHRKVNLDSLHDGEDTPVPVEKITWSDIIKDDPLDEDIWDDVERGYHSSGDDGDSAVGEVVSGRTSQTAQTFVEEDVTALARAQLYQPDQALLVASSSLQCSFDELSLIRDTLFMLLGLSTDLYVVNRGDGSVVPSTNSALLLTTQQSTTELMYRAARSGSALNYLRAWVKSPQTEPYTRACQASLQALLSESDNYFTAVQRCLVSPSADQVVSMMQLSLDAERRTRPLVLLADAVQKAAFARTDTGIALLNNLYDVSCTAQAIGDNETLDVSCKVLFAGTTTFLRKIAKWCLAGELDDNHQHPLVLDQDQTCSLARIWHHRFALYSRQTDANTMPAYLLDFTDELFAIGKSTMFLNLLRRPNSQDTMIVNPAADELIHLEIVPNSFIPLSMQLHDTLSAWVENLRTRSTSSVAELLVNEHKLIEHFDVLAKIFLRKDGASFSDFSEALYHHLHSAKRRQALNDFMLTEMTREAFSRLPNDSADNISMKLGKRRADMSIVEAIEEMQLQFVVPWYLANVMNTHSLKVYQEVFILLLELDITKRTLQAEITTTRTWPLGRNDFAKARSLCLRQCILAFVDALNLQITIVSQDLSTALEKALSKARNIDVMVTAYATFADSLAIHTMTHPGLKLIRSTITKILAIAETLAKVQRAEAGSKYALKAADMIDDYSEAYNQHLNFIIATLRMTSREQHYETLESYADALIACLPLARERSTFER